MNPISGNDRLGMFPDAECPDDNRSGVFRCAMWWRKREAGVFGPRLGTNWKVM